MDFYLSQEEEAFQKEVRKFLEEELTEGVLQENDGALYSRGPHTHKFVQKLGAKGWLSLSWPKEYGGENSFIKQAIFDDVTGYYRVPCGDVGFAIAGPTIIKVGSEEMKKEWLPKIASGEATFFLAYSEPDAG